MRGNKQTKQSRKTKARKERQAKQRREERQAKQRRERLRKLDAAFNMFGFNPPAGTFRTIYGKR